jgi:hypothetical protein
MTIRLNPPITKSQLNKNFDWTRPCDSRGSPEVLQVYRWPAWTTTKLRWAATQLSLHQIGMIHDQSELGASWITTIILDSSQRSRHERDIPSSDEQESGNFSIAELRHSVSSSIWRPIIYNCSARYLNDHSSTVLHNGNHRRWVKRAGKQKEINMAYCTCDLAHNRHAEIQSAAENWYWHTFKALDSMIGW